MFNHAVLGYNNNNDNKRNKGSCTISKYNRFKSILNVVHFTIF